MDTRYYHDGFAWWREITGAAQKIKELFKAYRARGYHALAVEDVDDKGRARLYVLEKMKRI